MADFTVNSAVPEESVITLEVVQGGGAHDVTVQLDLE